MKKLGAFALMLAALLVVLPGTVFAQNGTGDVTLTILHTNDTHARIVESKTEVGLARVATAFNQALANNPNTILVDAGDTFHGLPIANIDQGASVVAAMNQVGYSLMTTGNHDYNYGMDRLMQLEKLANFQILAANVYKDGKRVFTPYVIKNIGGVRVAFFGLATPETAYKTDPKNVQGIYFSDPIVEAKAVVYDLIGQYDVLVCLSHIGTDKSSDPTSIQIAEAVPQIDVMIDGHSHSTLEDIQKENKTRTLITSTGAYGSGLGVVDIVVGPDKKIKSRSARTITVANSPDLQPDPYVSKMIQDLSKAQDSVLLQVVGKTAVYLEGKREIVRTQQSNLGTLLANAMLYATGADIALMNGGGIRDSIPVGDITLKQVYTVQPFGNYIQTGKFKGSELDAILENGVGKLPAADGRFPHIAGWSYTLDASKPAGDRVSNIMVNGEPVDPDKEYTLATLNFEFNGGDGYTMLVGHAKNDFPSDAEIFVKYLQYLGTVTNENMVYKK
ncbi:MAG TPA: 5'-nucleotidase C-terminal domain-containing protein [Spirochaetales bacterium]|nr:5'-nucleotidase C-terminal domain-containing protein [Spirochaetales bacterium]